MVHFRSHENVAAQMSSATRADMSPMSPMSPSGHVAAAAVKPTDSELLMASVPPPEETSENQPEQSTPSDSGPAHPKPSEEGSSDTRQTTGPATAPRIKSQEDVREEQLIQPKKLVFNKSQPLANIMREAKDAESSKFLRKSAENEAKDAVPRG